MQGGGGGRGTEGGEEEGTFRRREYFRNPYAYYVATAGKRMRK